MFKSPKTTSFVISLQYLKNKMCDEVDFLYAAKHKSLLKIDTIVFYGDGQAFPKFRKY